jgi:hypothetical protein
MAVVCVPNGSQATPMRGAKLRRVGLLSWIFPPTVTAGSVRFFSIATLPSTSVGMVIIS